MAENPARKESGKAPAEKADKLKEAQRKVDEVAGVMRDNIEKAIDRGDKLDQLDDKSVQLEESASKFHKRTKDVSWMFRCRSYRNLAILVLLIIVVLVVILAAAGVFNKSS